MAMASRVELAGRMFIGGEWIAGKGVPWSSAGPLGNIELWQGNWADRQQADAAAAAAHHAFAAWSETNLEDRIAICRGFASYIEQHKPELAELIARETGKPRWEALTEVATVIGKVANSIDAILSRRWTTTEQTGTLLAVTRYRPHGVMLVLGPFNLPAHLPGAHIVPALLAGNTIVFKPSELTPAVGEWLAAAWQSVGLPAGVLNLVHGQAEVAQQLATHALVSGVLFTGSYRVGASLHKLLGGQPEKVLALEMGGNNPLIVHRVNQFESTVIPIIESAYISSGQRCTCARRLIVTPEGQPDRLIKLLAAAMSHVRVGLPMDDPQPFMGPLIRPAAASRTLAAQAQWLERGAEAIVPARADARSAALVTPGLLNATGVELGDEEHFGPLLVVQCAESLQHAVSLANQTRFGLAAGLLADSIDDYHYALHHLRSGIVNWNRQTTGASGRLPFGGVGASGNHAPSGFFAADYCSYPVASLETERLDLPQSSSPGLEDVVTLCSSK